MTRPVDCLEGEELDDGWMVAERLTRRENATGGHFSAGYLVRNKEGKEAYLKAIDYSDALRAEDFSGTLNAMTSAYLHERDVLKLCRDKRLSRVVVPLGYGEVTVNIPSRINRVPYIIFEKASGDIRDVLSAMDAFDTAWCLRSIHHAAIGIKQLHQNKIAHQDLKPSNVLVFTPDSSKLADLGSSSCMGITSPRDNCLIPGDTTYAAPEVAYRQTSTFEDRCIADLYLLGSLIFFYFGRVSATAAIRCNVSPSIGRVSSSAVYKDILPYLQSAFGAALRDLEDEINKNSPRITSELIQIARELCEPDPTKRGDPARRSSNYRRYDLERYISKFDLLAKKARYSR